LLIAFAFLAVVLGAIERLWPALAGQRWRRQGFATDAAYWLFTPVVTRGVTRATVGLAVLVLAAAAGLSLDPARLQELAQGSRTMRGLPRAVQALLVLLAGDFIGYWTHRAFHRGRLWPFHAVHHSSVEVDWLSAVRLHPVNDVLSRLAQALPLLLLGLPAALVAAYAPLLTLHALLLHANVPWTFGRLRFVIASPVFHRWHHSAEEEGRDCNFAGLFPLWDLLFGTFHMPAGRQARRFGVSEPVPAGLLAQLAYPFGRATA
jgi:sterol desaturase/sphingolipid hydroxylase (fatty acid hydroxylase superfamily)